MFKSKYKTLNNPRAISGIFAGLSWGMCWKKRVDLRRKRGMTHTQVSCLLFADVWRGEDGRLLIAGVAELLSYSFGYSLLNSKRIVFKMIDAGYFDCDSKNIRHTNERSQWIWFTPFGEQALDVILSDIDKRGAALLDKFELLREPMAAMGRKEIKKIPDGLRGGYIGGLPI
jgi:hypothetical protein